MTDTTALKNQHGIFLALGGGAARGLAHLGVMQAFQRHGIPISGICGTSMGALVGAIYALSPDAAQVIGDIADYLGSDHFNRARYSFIRKVQKTENDDGKHNLRQKLQQGILLGRSFTTGSIVPYKEFEGEIHSLLPAKTFRNTKIPFFAVSLDLVQSKEVVFNKGYLRPAVMASCAIPGVFPAVASGEGVYVDGGWMNKIPVSPLIAFGAERVLALDVSDEPVLDFNPKRGYSLLTQTHRAAQVRLQELQLAGASMIWRLPVKDLHWAEFAQIDKAVAIGSEFAEAHIDEAKNLLHTGTRPSWRQRLGSWIAGGKNRPERAPGFEIRSIWEASEAEETYQ